MSTKDAAAPGAMDQLRRFGPPTVIVILAVLFVAQNREDANFDFTFFTFTTPLWLMLVVFFALGAASAWWMSRRRRN